MKLVQETSLYYNYNWDKDENDDDNKYIGMGNHIYSRKNSQLSISLGLRFLLIFKKITIS